MEQWCVYLLDHMESTLSALNMRYYMWHSSILHLIAIAILPWTFDMFNLGKLFMSFDMYDGQIQGFRVEIWYSNTRSSKAYERLLILTVAFCKAYLDCIVILYWNLSWMPARKCVHPYTVFTDRPDPMLNMDMPIKPLCIDSGVAQFTG